MDFGFMRASVDDYSWASKSKDCLVHLYNGYTLYLLVVNEAWQFIWVFSTLSKDPQLDIVAEFLQQHGHKDSGCVQTDQGGKLAWSHAFQDMLLWDYHYTLEPTGSDSPSQNGAAEIYNNKFGIKTRTLLYGSGLPAKYWSAALCHSVYLHNCLVHHKTKKTPFKGYYGLRPDLSQLKVFGSRVCVKRAGNRAGKLDHNNFTGIFLGYSAMDHNVHYSNLTSGIVKTSHHAEFNEAWYLQPHHPLAAQLLYDLGLEYQDDEDKECVKPIPKTTTPIPKTTTPLTDITNVPTPPLSCLPNGNYHHNATLPPMSHGPR
jgi:hypothetical protein